MASMTPILVLHGLLLPINIYRLTQMSRSPRRAPPLLAHRSGSVMSVNVA
jgi:hypothetical protein